MDAPHSFHPVLDQDDIVDMDAHKKNSKKAKKALVEKCDSVHKDIVALIIARLSQIHDGHAKIGVSTIVPSLFDCGKPLSLSHKCCAMETKLTRKQQCCKQRICRT